MAVAGNRASTAWRLVGLVNDAIDRVRVELQGTYTHDRLRELAAYAQRPHSHSRALSIALLTPLPCYVALIVVDSLPLAPIEGGIATQTAAFWLRTALGGGSMAGAAFLTMVESVPALHMSTRALVLIGPVIGGLTLLPAYVLIKLIGFPLPFALITNSPNWSNLMVIATLLIWKNTLRANKKARDDLLHVVITFSALISTVFVYTALSYLFSILGASSQNVVSCSLPFVKIAFKNWVNAGLHHSPEIKPIYSVFTLDLFHAMFISTATQQNIGGSALLIVMIVDVVLSVVAMYEVYSVACRVRVAQEESRRRRRQTERQLSQRRLTQVAASCGPITYALHILDTSERVRSCVSQGSTRLVMTARIVPVAGKSVNLPATGVDPELTIVELILKLLYMTEFYVLTEYAEAIVAFIYGVYLYTLSFLPNRVYYTQLAMLTPDEQREKAVRVLTYASLEMLSLVVFCVVLGRIVGCFSPIGQLGFVLEKHWRFIQSLLVNWITFVVFSTVQHLGADFTFQFKWLKHQNGTP